MAHKKIFSPFFLSCPELVEGLIFTFSLEKAYELPTAIVPAIDFHPGFSHFSLLVIIPTVTFRDYTLSIVYRFHRFVRINNEIHGFASHNVDRQYPYCG
jgi:hypothetical protein